MLASLTPRASDYSAWYNELVVKAGLAEGSEVRGCMVIKPYGFSLWNRIQRLLDQRIQETGHENAYFPLLIPASYLSREAAHVEGFAKECAVVTHYRLKQQEAKSANLVVDPEAALEEPLIVRPTSETIIWNSFRKWIQSYRDLPILLNQWANVVRWEMRTRPFLRTMEILWQEGHTAHATAEEAQAEARKMHDLYADFITQYLAIPVIQGEKTAYERFAGAEVTYTLEALMQDGKALQLGTSHMLGQNFARAFDVKFARKDGVLDHVWGTSWGVTTRLIGALVMVHGDDKGLVLPPKVAPIQVVVVPIPAQGADATGLRQYVQEVEDRLHKVGVRIHVDTDDHHHPGWKFTTYECKGVPIRVVVGPRDMRGRQVEVSRRDTGEKAMIALDRLEDYIMELLTSIQNDIYARAQARQKAQTQEVWDYPSFKEVMRGKKGFVLAHWDGTTATERRIKEETKATIRCIPLPGSQEAGSCIYTGKPSSRRVLFAQAY